MSQRRATLPSKQEMMLRLNAIDDDIHLQQRLYPHLAESAGLEMVADSIAITVALSIFAFTRHKPVEVKNRVNMLAPHIVDAIVDDRVIAMDTKHSLMKVL